jgi:uncharacterized protein YjbI with pentapeptide repeats
VLCAFVRGHARPATDEELEKPGPLGLSERAADVQAAVTVLGRRRAPVDAAEPLDLREADLRHAALEDAQLQGADLAFANLEGARLDRAQLQAARLKWVRLRYATLIGAQLQDSDLRSATLEHADLRNAQLQGAVCDSETDWPEGFDWKAAGVRHD